MSTAFGVVYDRVRKAYGLASGVLLTWELIGIEFGAAPVENLKVTLKSPQAIPYVLIALVTYFAFRITVEWYQTDLSRRRLLASRLDFAVAHTIGGAALALYAVQTALHVQLANEFASQRFGYMGAGMAAGFIVCSLVMDYVTQPRVRRSTVIALVIFIAFSVPFWWAWYLRLGIAGLTLLGIGTLFGVALRGAIAVLVGRLRGQDSHSVPP